MLRLPLILTFAVIVAGACSSIPPDPLQLDHGLLTVNNRTDNDWQGVEIWANRSFRVTVASIPSGGRFQVPMDAFVAGDGQRLDPLHTMVRDVRLTAKTQKGDAVAVDLQFKKSGLAALGGRN